jgi:hypothetical protein
VWSGISWPFSITVVAERLNTTDVKAKKEAMKYLSEVTVKGKGHPITGHQEPRGGVEV